MPPDPGGVQVPSAIDSYLMRLMSSIQTFVQSVKQLVALVRSAMLNMELTSIAISLRSFYAGTSLVNLKNTFRYVPTRFARRHEYFNVTEKPAFIKFIKFATR